MTTDLSRQLIDAEQRVQRQQQLSRREAELREAVTQETYRSETFETQLNMIAGDLEKLEGFGLSSLMTGMFGKKQERIDAARQAGSEIEHELDTCRAALSGLQAELDAVVPELAALQGCREGYEALFARREAEILAGAGAAAEQLKALFARQEQIKDRLRSARKADETAESVLHSLSTAKISVRQVNKRKMQGEGLAGGMYNALLSQALRPSRSGLGTALDKLMAILEGLHGEMNPEGSPEERALRGAIHSYRSRFMACPQLEEDCEALVDCETETADLHRALRDRARGFEHCLAELADQRRAIIEQA